MHMCIHMYGPVFQPPSPPRPWSWVSHSTVPFPLWCGGGVVPPCGVVRVWYCMDGRYGM